MIRVREAHRPLGSLPAAEYRRHELIGELSSLDHCRSTAASETSRAMREVAVYLKPTPSWARVVPLLCVRRSSKPLLAADDGRAVEDWKTTACDALLAETE